MSPARDAGPLISVPRGMFFIVMGECRSMGLGYPTQEGWVAARAEAAHRVADDMTLGRDVWRFIVVSRITGTALPAKLDQSPRLLEPRTFWPSILWFLFHVFSPYGNLAHNTQRPRRLGWRSQVLDHERRKLAQLRQHAEGDARNKIGERDEYSSFVMTSYAPTLLSPSCARSWSRWTTKSSFRLVSWFLSLYLMRAPSMTSAQPASPTSLLRGAENPARV